MFGSEIFKDLLVVELASVLAGPAVGMFFAELGASVVKIENKSRGGDVTRNWKLPTEDSASPVSAYYHSVNWGKEVRLLDLSAEDGKVELFQLLAAADILISNFRLPSAQRLGLDYASLKTKFPQLIYGQITGYGEKSDLPAFDIVLQAEAGFMYMTGEPGRLPSRMPVALIDLLAAHQLKEGLLIALLQRERTGKGAYVTTSLRDSAVASLANQASNWLVAGHIPQRMGSRHPNIAPYGDVFETKDQKLIVLAVGTEGQFAGLCKCLEMENILTDPRFFRNDLRVSNREALRELLAQKISSLDLERLKNLFLQHGVPFGCIRNMQEVFDDPDIQALILEDDPNLAHPGKRVRTAVFQIK